MAKNDVTTDEGAKAVEQIKANIERVYALIDREAIDELGAETEELISSLSGKGSIAVKTEHRAAWNEAASNVITALEATKAEVAPRTAAPVVDFNDFAGVPELINMGAEKVAEGVRLHIKTSVTAREIAAIGLDMWLRIPDKNGNPDIDGKSDPAKKASTKLKQVAGEALASDGLDAYDVETELKKLWRSVQTQRTDVRAQYLRDLDADTEEAEAERAKFSSILDGKPEDTPASVWVANHYGVSLKGEIEKARERYHRSLAAGGEGAEDIVGATDDPKELESADDRVRLVVKRMRSDIAKAKPEDWEAASEETKRAAREELMKLSDAIKDMITATI